MLQAAWALLLTSLTGQHDVVFGTTVSGRPAEVVGAESMVGLFVNTVPVGRTSPRQPPPQTCSTSCNAPKTTVEHQHLALSDIHRIAGHEQLFDTLLVYENYPIDTGALFGTHDLTVTGFTSRQPTHYPLTLVAIPGDELGIRVQFRTDVFEAAGIGVLIERWRRVLVAMTADPSRRLSSVDLLDEGEYARLDVVGNRAALTRTPVSASIPVLFAAQVARTPEAAAVTFEGRSLTYRELDEAANRLAHLLAAHGAGPGAAVGLLLRRSAEAVVAIVAVLRPGRPTYRSTQRIPGRGSGWCSPTPRRSP